MKNFYSKVIILILVVIFSFTTLLVGCGDEPIIPAPSVNNTIVLETSEKELDIDETFYIKVSEFTKKVGENFVYSSSNDKVASVQDDGLVKGLSIGEADITVTYNGVSAVCKIKVKLDEKYPVTIFNAVSNDKEVQEIFEGDKLDLSCYVKYNQTKYLDADFDYTLSDNSLGEISSDGIFTANTLPNGVESSALKVTVTAKWRNASTSTLTNIINVLIKKSYVYLDRHITVNGLKTTKLTVDTCESVSWYPNETFNNEVDFVVKGFGEDSSNNNIDLTSQVITEIILGSDKIEIAGNKIIGKKGGLAVVRLSLPADINGLPPYVLEVEIEVTKPIIPYNGTLGSVSNPISFSEGVDVSSLGFTSITYAVQEDGTENAKSLEIDNNKLLGVNSERERLTQTVLTVGDDTYLVRVPAVGYTRIIDDELELYETLVLSSTSKQVDGYYFVANDIEDVANITPESNGLSAHTVSLNNATTNGVGFIGTLDGNGKTVKFNTRAWGLFGNIGSTALIKNIALILNKPYNNIAWNQTNYPGMTLLSGNAPRGKMENVYFGINPEFGDIQDVYLGVNLFDRLTTSVSAQYKNVVFDLPQCYTLSDLSYSSSYIGTNYDKANNIYFRTAPPSLRNPRYTGLLIGYCTLESSQLENMFENVYVINHNNTQNNYLSYSAEFNANNEMTSFRKYFAENDTQSLENSRITDAVLGIDNSYYGVIKGVNCYNSHIEMKNALEQNSDLIVGSWKIIDVCNVVWQGA